MKKNKVHFIIIILIILNTIIIATIYLTHIRNLITTNTLKNLGEIAKQDTINIQNTIQEHKRILTTIVNEINQENPLKEEDIFKIYERNSGKEEFSRIGILYEDGKTSTSDSGIVDLSEDIKYFFQNNYIQLSKSRKSKVDEHEINIYSQKITWKMQEVIILLVVETEKYEKIFSQTIYNGNGLEYIITKEGIIIANSEKEPNGKNMYQGLKSKSKNTKNIEKMEEEIQNSKDGQIVCKMDHHNYYIAYQTLDIEDWNLVIITQGSIIAQELNQILQITFFIAIVIIIMIFSISAYIVISNIKKGEKLYELAYIDRITKLGNQNYFLEKGKEWIENNHDKTYLMILDVDKFKSFNKKYGHTIGNKLLNKIGKVLNQTIRGEKIICRLSNDIYGILLKEDGSIEKIAEKIESSLSKIIIDGREYIIYITIGIYKVKEEETEISKIMDKAIIAHNHIKGNYDKKYKIFDEKIEADIEKEHEIEIVMQEALKNKEFEVFYQPKISSLTEKMQSAEALVRWKKNGQLIPPNEFIPIFEKNQFIIKLDEYIFEMVCKDVEEWKNKYENIPTISINVSKEHLIKEDFANTYMKIAEKYKINPQEMEIEITESATIGNQKDIIKVMKQMKKIGFAIAIDDFGTGYSSLSMLQTLPIDIIKIDKVFINQISIKETDRNLVEYIILIAKKLKLKTVAEGVETKEEVQYLKKLGCDFIQGYYYSKPLKKEAFEKLFTDAFDVKK